ncbi:hypothetical protein XELAEV_18005802mg [Xenopus laevis]|uniref:Uncharacterized protein n=1 Tax=Xenopus laevis TaxID=8355 RepID=A0A974DXP6_XENLA|nr:hypothetical protein XELAEV_18005802mg [Xenopus laevis]
MQEPIAEKEGEIGGENQTDNGLDYEAPKDVVEELNREIHFSTIFPKIVTTEEASESPKGIFDISSQDEDVIPEHGNSTTLFVTEPTLKNTLDEQVTITHDKNIENVGGVTDFESKDYITDVEDTETQISTILPQFVTTEETNKFQKVIYDISFQDQVVTSKYSYTAESGITETTLKNTDGEQAAITQEKDTGTENGRAGKIKESGKGASHHLKTGISSQDQVVTPEYSYTAELGVTEATLKHVDGEQATITQEKNTVTENSRVITDSFSEDNTAGETKGTGKGVNHHSESGISSKDQGIFISTFAAGHGDTAEYYGTQATNTDNKNVGINNEKHTAGSIREDVAYIQFPYDQTDYSAGRKVDLYPVDGKTPDVTDCIKYKHLCKNIKHAEESKSVNSDGNCHTSILGCDQKGKKQKNKKDSNPKANPGPTATVLGKDSIGRNSDKVKENYSSRIQSIYRTIIFGSRQRRRNLKSPGLIRKSKKSSSESSSESNSDSRQIYR